MLQTLKQMKGILNFEKNFSKEASSWAPEKFQIDWKLENLSDEQIKDFLIDNYWEVQDWIIQNKWNDLFLEKTEVWEQNWDEIIKLTKLLGLNQNDIERISVSEFLTELRNFAISKLESQKQTKEKLSRYYEEMNSSLGKDVEIETWEQISEIWHSFLWLRLSNITREDYFKHVNLWLFKNILNHAEFSIKESYNNILQIQNWKWFRYWDFKSKQVIKFFEKYWYSSKTFQFWNKYKEAAWLSILLEDIIKTQEKVNSWNYAEKSKILFDFNADWKISSKVSFNLQESQALMAINNKTTFDNVLTNLWIDSVAFEKKISENYFIAREELKERLAGFLETKWTSWNMLLLNPSDFDRAKKELNSRVEKENISLEQAKIKLWQKFDAALAEKNIKISDEVKRKSINLMVWDLNWASITVDSMWKKISSMTNWLIDNVSFWFADWKIWLIIGWSKQFFNDRVTIGGGLANFVPYLTLNWDLIRTDNATTEEFFAKEMKTGVNVNAWINVTPLGLGWNITFDKVNEQTATWIKQMVENMSKNLDEFIKYFPAKFEDSPLAQIQDKNELAVQKANYERTLEEFKRWIYNSDGTKNDALILEFKAWILRAYQNELYKNAEWTKFSGITLWVLGPIVYFGPKFQKISQNYVKKDTKFIDEWIQREQLLINQRNERLEKSIGRDINLSFEGWKDWIEAVDKSDLDAVKSVNSEISSYIDWKDIIQKLSWTIEKDIHKLLKWNWWDISKIFEKFISQINPKNTDLITELNSFKWEWQNLRQILILQNVAINLMKKEWLKVQNGSVNVNWETTIVTWYKTVNWKRTPQYKKVKITNLSDYDRVHGRSTYFDNIFKQEFKTFPWDIADARKAYYEKYGTKSNYTLRTLNSSEWIAMAWVEIWTWKNKTKGINPYVTPNIATFDNGDGKINFTPKNLKASTEEMAGKIPEHMITPMINELKLLWYTFKSTDEKWQIQEFRDLVKNSWDNSNLTITNKFYFTKAWECLNDMILMDFDVKYKNSLIIPWVKIDISNAKVTKLDTYVAENKATDISITGSKDTTKPDVPNTDVKTTTADKVTWQTKNPTEIRESGKPMSWGWTAKKPTKK